MLPVILSSSNPTEIDAYLQDNYLNNIQQIHTLEIIDKNSLGIEPVREFLTKTYFKDNSSINLFLIKDGHKLTVAAQNTLLKSLEESSENQQFIITTNNHHLLLDTLVSRCLIINLKSDGGVGERPLEITIKILQSLSRSPAGELITLSDEIQKGDAKATILDFIYFLRKNFRNHPNSSRAEVLNTALNCLDDLNHNFNEKLVVDHFLLKSAEVIKMNPATN